MIVPANPSRCLLTFVTLMSLHAVLCLRTSLPRHSLKLDSSRLHLPSHYGHHNDVDITVSVHNDDNETLKNHLKLLLWPSQAINTHRWKKKASTYRHNVTTFKAAHELVADRRSHALGFEAPKSACLLHPAGDFAGFSSVTSVPYMKLDDGSLSFAMFNNTGKRYAVSSLRNGEWTPSAHESAALKDCLYSPSAAFLQDSNTTLLNSGHYHPTVYQRNDDNWDKVVTAPFYRAGGENIGSLFTQKLLLYASLRFNVPYNPTSIGGHGYRSIGTYSVSVNDTASSKVESWLAPDSCLETCYVDWRNTASADSWLSLDAQTFRACIAPHGEDFERSLAVDDGRCLRLAMGNDSATDEGGRESFVSLVGCAHECRARNQLYQPAISVHGDHMVGVVARYVGTDNCADACGDKFHVCQVLDGFEWDQHCFDDDSVFFTGTEGAYGHPVSSELVLHGDAYYMVTAAKARTDCSAHVHHWPRRTFSYITTQAGSLQGRVTLRMFSPASGLVVLFCQSTDASRTCTDGVKVTALVDGGGSCSVSVGPLSREDGAMERVQCEFKCSPGSTSMTLNIGFMKWHRLYGLSTV